MTKRPPPLPRRSWRSVWFASGAGAGAVVAVLYLLHPASRALGLPMLILAVAAASIALLAYFSPTLVAYVNRHRKMRWIAAINLFAGWTVIGWVGAMVWACIRPREAEAPDVDADRYSDWPAGGLTHPAQGGPLPGYAPTVRVFDADEFEPAPLRDLNYVKKAQRIVVLDVETTGLQGHDRIVTLGACRIVDRTLERDMLYLVFDPRRDSHPEAAAIHGWDDWALRHQDLFADRAEEVRAYLADADLIVCHNSAFDMRFVEREIRKAGLEPLGVPVFCTMEHAREIWRGSAKLDTCLQRVGLKRAGTRHGALEDAVLTAALFMNMMLGRPRCELPQFWPAPSNLKLNPPRPPGDLPRRTPKRRRPVAPEQSTRMPAPEPPPADVAAAVVDREAEGPTNDVLLNRLLAMGYSFQQGDGRPEAVRDGQRWPISGRGDLLLLLDRPVS